MKRPEEHTLEEESRRKLKSVLPPEWIIRDITPDYGLDMEITLVDGEEVTNKVIAAQIKATKGISERQENISHPIPVKDLLYYENYPLPVFIIFYVKSQNSFYYVMAQKYLRENISSVKQNWRKQKELSISFSSNSKIADIDNLKSYIVECCFYIKQISLNDNPRGAIYWLDGIPKSDNENVKNRLLVALTHIRDYKFDKAIIELNNILRQYTTSPTEKIVILNSLGQCYLSTSEYHDALDIYKTLFTIVKKVDKEISQEGLSTAFGNMAIVYRSIGDLDKALKYSRKSLKIMQETENLKAEAGMLNNLGIIYRIKCDTNNAMKYTQQALKIHRKIGNQNGEAVAIGNLGNIYQLMGDLNTALRSYKTALKLHKEMGNKYGEANNLGSIGIIYENYGNSRESLRCFRGSLKLHRSIMDKEDEATDLGNIGNVYYNIDIDKSLRYYKRALNLQIKIGDKHGQAYQYGNIGNIYGKKGDYPKAKGCYRIALEIFKEIGDIEGIKQVEETFIRNSSVLY